jgi:hypothetical protein
MTFPPMAVRFLAPPAQSTEQVLTVVQNWTARG